MMQASFLAFGLAGALALFAPAVAGALAPATIELAVANSGVKCDPSDWTATWDTEFGPMRTKLVGDGVEGDYDYDDGRLSGTLDDTGCILTGTWVQSIKNRLGPGYDSGSLIFVLAIDGLSWSGNFDNVGEGIMRGGWNGRRVAAVAI